MSTPQDALPTTEPAALPVVSPPPPEIREQGVTSTEEIAVEITDIKASGLPARVGLFGGLFYVRVKGGKVPQRTRTARYVKGGEFVAAWGDTVKLSGLESSKVEIEVFARRFFFNYKVIKKTESKENLADLLEHAGDAPVELELLGRGQAAGKLVFKISRGVGVDGGTATTDAPSVPPAPADASEPGSTPDPNPNPVPPASVPDGPEQVA